LADDRKLRSVLRQHSRKLDEWIKSTKDQGEQPEDPQVVAYWQDDMAKSYLEEMKRRNLAPEISDEEYLKWWEKKLLGQEHRRDDADRDRASTGMNSGHARSATAFGR
jgi:uncharacterized sulfatase